MTPDDPGKPALTRPATEKEIRATLEQPIAEGVNYFDATAAILLLTEQYRQMENRMVSLEKLLELQGDINGKLLGHMNQLLLDNAGEAKSSVGLIIPN